MRHSLGIDERIYFDSLNDETAENWPEAIVSPAEPKNGYNL